MLQGLLEKAPTLRPSMAQIKESSWFQGFDWAALAAQTMQAPDPPELAHVHVHTSLMPDHLKPELFRKAAAGGKK